MSGNESWAESEIDVPDTVPDELSEQYVDEARRMIVASRVETLRSANSDRRDFLSTWVFLFACAVIAAVFVGALVYAVILWPTVGVAVNGGVIAMLVSSLLAARRLSRAQQAIPMRV